MICPQCGTEFEGQASSCLTCGWDFAGDPSAASRISALAITALALGLLSLVTLYLTFMPAVIVGALAIRRIRRSHGRLTGEHIAIASIVIPLLAIPIFISLGRTLYWKDAGPVPNEFTEADLVTVRPENESSWQILCLLNDAKDDPNGFPAIGFSGEDIELLDNIYETVCNPGDSVSASLQIAREYRQDILHLWHKGRRGIDIIHQLSMYDELADLSPPTMTPDEIAIADLKWIGRLIACYVYSLSAEGNYTQAVNELIIYNDVIRKRSVSTRSTLAELTCYAALLMNLETASIICTDSYIAESTLQSLKKEFESLGEKELSLRNPLICEYIGIKKCLIDLSNEQDPNARQILKMNSSLRYFQSYIQCQLLLSSGSTCSETCPISVWPWEKPNWPRIKLTDDTNWLYFGYNPAGYMFVQIATPAYDKLRVIKTNVLVQDDLFQWILARRLGQEASLGARAYSDEYTIDIEKEIIFSVGPDSVPYTDDDITMRINPAALGLK